jgi:diguanylate cyclase (GGDEF)-like protein
VADQLQRSLKTILLPALLLLLVYLLHVPLSRELDKLGLLSANLPYVLFGLGMVFSLLFRHSREFFNLLILTLSYLALDRLIWHPLTVNLKPELLFDLICLLAPVNLVLNDLLYERGILNRYGLYRLLLIVLQVGMIAWIVITAPGWIHHAMNFSPETMTTPGMTPIPPLARLTILLSGLTLLIYVFTHPSVLQGALLINFVTLLLGLEFFEAPALALPYFILAGLITIVALIQNSHLLAYHDELTQLPSRRALRQQLMELGSQYTIAMVDVDHFKKLNDSYGHDVGDQVLRMLAARLRKVKGGCKAFRYGGEEFTLIFPGKLRNEALGYLEQLRAVVASTAFRIRQRPRPKARPKSRPDSSKSARSNKSLKVTVSIGVADNSRADSHAATMKLADQALYRAKQNGRNQVVG